MSITYIITLIAAAIIITRLLTYRRRGRYRPAIAIITWLLIATVTIISAQGPTECNLTATAIALTLATLAISLLRTRGDVAHLLRPLKRQ